MKTRIAAFAGLLLALTMAGCTNEATRIVDCAPGYHNASGPDSDCVPNSAAPSHSKARK